MPDCWFEKMQQNTKTYENLKMYNLTLNWPPKDPSKTHWTFMTNLNSQNPKSASWKHLVTLRWKTFFKRKSWILFQIIYFLQSFGTNYKQNKYIEKFVKNFFFGKILKKIIFIFLEIFWVFFSCVRFSKGFTTQKQDYLKKIIIKWVHSIIMDYDHIWN